MLRADPRLFRWVSFGKYLFSPPVGLEFCIDLVINIMIKSMLGHEILRIFRNGPNWTGVKMFGELDNCERGVGFAIPANKSDIFAAE